MIATSNRLTIFCLIFLFQLVSLASEGVPNNSYLSRPKIESLVAQDHSGLDGFWNDRFKKAHFFFAATLMEFYKDQNIYFLARDSELVYDAALLIKGEQSNDRLHLINVSRANMGHSNLPDYLASNGIDERSLTQGPGLVLIDTGFAGTIPNRIQQLFPEQLRKKLKSHFILSSNPQIPSGYSFLIHLNPLANTLSPTKMHGSIVSYEHMPRFNNRSDHYQLINDVWNPLTSEELNSDDGSVNPGLAQKYMESLKATWLNPGFQDEILNFRQTISELVALFRSEHPRAAKILALFKFLSEENGLERPIKEAFLRDLIAVQNINFSGSDISIQDLDLAETQISTNKKLELIQAYPEYKELLENPNVGVLKLFQEKRYDQIGFLIDASIDAEIDLLLKQHLFSFAPKEEPLIDLQVVYIESHQSMGDAVWFKKNLWNKAYFLEMTKQMKAFLRTQFGGWLFKVEEIYKASFQNKLEIMKYAVELGKVEDLGYMLRGKLDEQFDDVLLDFVNKAEGYSAKFISRYFFDRKMTSKNIEAIRVLFQKDDKALYDYKEHVLQKIMKKEMNSELYRQALLILDGVELGTQNVSLKQLLDSKGDYSRLYKTIDSTLTAGDIIEIDDVPFSVQREFLRKDGLVYFSVKSQITEEPIYSIIVPDKADPRSQAAFVRMKKLNDSYRAASLNRYTIFNDDEHFAITNKFDPRDLIDHQWASLSLAEYFGPKQRSKYLADHLFGLVQRFTLEGRFIKDFSPEHIINSSQRWLFVGTGEIEDGLSRELAFEKWQAAIKQHWNMDLPELSCEQLLKN